MKVAVIGATGFVGKNIVNELVTRGHLVKGISRKGGTSNRSNLEYQSIDVSDKDKLAEAIQDVDVVISAFNAGWQNPNLYDDFIKGSKNIELAVKKADINRYIVIGGAGSLYTNEHLQLVDTPDFPKEIFPGASAARDYLNELKSEKNLDWVFFSPAIEMHPGITVGRTGKYRLGKDQPVFDDNQRSILSVEDVAVVIADEVEKPKHHRERFTAGY